MYLACPFSFLYPVKIKILISFRFKAFRTMASSVQALASGSIAAVSLASLAPASQKLVSRVAGFCYLFFFGFFSFLLQTRILCLCLFA